MKVVQLSHSVTANVTQSRLQASDLGSCLTAIKLTPAGVGKTRAMARIIFHSMEESAYLWTVMHVADEKGVSYELAPLIYRSAEHLSLHPFAKMPVVQHDDFFLYESAAIAHYIDHAFDGPALQPVAPRAQANVLRWVSIVNAYVFPIMNRFMKERLVRPLWGAQPDLDFLKSAREPLMTQMRLIDEAVGEGFLVGHELTIADSFLFPHLLFFSRTPEGEALLGRAPQAVLWLTQMMIRPSYVASRMSRAFEAFHQLPAPSEMVWPLE